MASIPILPERDWYYVKGKPGTRYADRIGVAVGFNRKRDLARVIFSTSEKWKQPLNRNIPTSDLKVISPWQEKS